MEKQTKILIGLAVLGTAAYFIFRPKGDKTNVGLGGLLEGTNTTDRFICPEGYTKNIEVVGGVVGITYVCKDANGKTVQQFENPNYIDTESQFICPKGSYNNGRQTPNVPDETCSDGSTATKNPNFRPKGASVYSNTQTPTIDGTYVFLKDTEVTDYMGGDFPSTKKFKKGDFIEAYIYEVQGNSCQSKGIGYAMPMVERTREDCYPLRTNLPNGMAINIPYNSVESAAALRARILSQKI